jgi:hypothetical protein
VQVVYKLVADSPMRQEEILIHVSRKKGPPQKRKKCMERLFVNLNIIIKYVRSRHIIRNEKTCSSCERSDTKSRFNKRDQLFLGADAVVVLRTLILPGVPSEEAERCVC